MSVVVMKEALAKICEKYSLIAVYFFGSLVYEACRRLEGGSPFDQMPEADLDVGVLPAWGNRLRVQEKVEISIELEDMFNVKRVDLLDPSKAPAFLALDVIRGELVFASDKDQEAEFELFVLRRAGDLAPFERQRQQMILGE